MATRRSAEFARTSHGGIPDKANLVQPRPPFGGHFVPISALGGTPKPKSDISCLMKKSERENVPLVV